MLSFFLKNEKIENKNSQFHITRRRVIARGPLGFNWVILRSNTVAFAVNLSHGQIRPRSARRTARQWPLTLENLSAFVTWKLLQVQNSEFVILKGYSRLTVEALTATLSFVKYPVSNYTTKNLFSNSHRFLVAPAAGAAPSLVQPIIFHAN